MSTIPLTVVEGLIAIPRARPLALLPASFGCDWTLVPPHASWRAELKALYCALLRTFCMSNERFLSLCAWTPLGAVVGDERSEAAANAPAAGPGPLPASDRDARPVAGSAPAAPAAPAVQAAPASLASMPPPARTRAHRSSPNWSVLTRSACAVGVAVWIAWPYFAHDSHRQVESDAENADTQTSTPDTPRDHASRSVLEDRPPRPVDAAPIAQTSAARADHDASAGYVAMRHDTSSDRASAHDARRHGRREAASQLARPGRPDGRAHPSLYAGPTRRSVARHLSDDAPTVSRAGAFSPFAPQPLGVGEYEEVTLSSATRLPARTMAVMAPGEWMTHITQRRITEIPDQFGKQ